MVVGVCRIVLALPGNASLKGKRSVVRKVIERARQRFQVAAAEVADLDVHQRATLGFACVANDGRHVESVLGKLSDFVAGATEAQVISESVELLRPNLEPTLPNAEDDLAAWEARGDDWSDDG
jgi:uncharacterized protein YlxP (DUF503 family)